MSTQQTGTQSWAELVGSQTDVGRALGTHVIRTRQLHDTLLTLRSLYCYLLQEGSTTDSTLGQPDQKAISDQKGTEAVLDQNSKNSTLVPDQNKFTRDEENDDAGSVSSDSSEYSFVSLQSFDEEEKEENRKRYEEEHERELEIGARLKGMAPSEAKTFIDETISLVKEEIRAACAEALSLATEFFSLKEQVSSSTGIEQSQLNTSYTLLHLVGTRLKTFPEMDETQEARRATNYFLTRGNRWWEDQSAKS